MSKRKFGELTLAVSKKQRTNGGRRFFKANTKTAVLALRKKVSDMDKFQMASASSRVPRGMPGFPKEKVVKMTYAAFRGVTSSSGAIVKTHYRANSIHDPDETGTGHQALGHDQWKQFYNHYVVIGSKITVEASWRSGAFSAVVGVGLMDDTTSATTWTTIAEQGLGVHKMLTDSNSVLPVVMFAKFSAKQFYNVKDVKDNLDRLGATFDANPNEVATYTVWAQALDESTTVIIDQKVFIEYIVLMSEPKELPQS